MTFLFSCLLDKREEREKKITTITITIEFLMVKAKNLICKNIMNLIHGPILVSL